MTCVLWKHAHLRLKLNHTKATLLLPSHTEKCVVTIDCIFFMFPENTLIPVHYYEKCS